VVQTLDRGLRVLALLAGAPAGLTVRETAAELEVHRAVVYRLLGTLEAHRLVAKDGDGRYRLGSGLAELAAAVTPDWRRAALPELERLADEVGATAVLSVASGESCVALVSVEPRTTVLHVAYRPGLRHPLAVGASGKAILGGRPPVEGEPPDVAQARRRGYAVSRGELQPGAVGIAAPVSLDGWAEASVAVVSLAELGRTAPARVRAAAERIARALAE
jgi:DNA-binding IclR family transcriptional regulator